MNPVIHQLVSHPSVRKSGASSASAIVELEKRYGVPIPSDVRHMWSMAARFELLPLNSALIGPADVLELTEAQGFDFGSMILARGFLPLYDDHSSDYLALILHGPAAQRVALIPHDDGTHLQYRDLTSFASALLHAMESDTAALQFSNRRASVDYSVDTPRTIEDDLAGKALLQTDGKCEEWNYAAQLLSDSSLTELGILLEKDHFVRRDLLARLRTSRSPHVRELLRLDQEKFETFVATVRAEASIHGHAVGERNGSVLQINGQWYEMEVFFHRRNIPNAIPRLMNWLSDSAANLNPNSRPGNYLVDL